jgi:HAD superfamily hydrolase (TIGR01662 family)
VALYRERCKEDWRDGVILLPGARELLEALQSSGILLAVITNKDGDTSRNVASHLKIDSLFECIVGMEDTPYRKPRVELTMEVVDRLKLPPSDCLLIGDSPFDAEAAHVADMPAVLVATGSHSVPELMKTTAAAVYPDLFALSREVFGLEIRRELPS